jgi:hypothetical protein
MQRTGTAPMHRRFPLFAHDPTNSGLIKPVVVHVRNVVESEVSAASDPALVDQAVALVKGSIGGWLSPAKAGAIQQPLLCELGLQILVRNMRHGRPGSMSGDI